MSIPTQGDSQTTETTTGSGNVHITVYNNTGSSKASGKFIVTSDMLSPDGTVLTNDAFTGIEIVGWLISDVSKNTDYTQSGNTVTWAGVVIEVGQTVSFW